MAKEMELFEGEGVRDEGGGERVEENDTSSLNPSPSTLAEGEVKHSDLFNDMLSNRNNPEFYEAHKKTMRDFADIEADFGSVKTWGPKVTLEEIAGKSVYFWGFKIAPSVKKQGTECLTMLLEIESTGEKVVLFTGSTVLSKLCLRHEKLVPFRGKIIKVKNYYAFE